MKMDGNIFLIKLIKARPIIWKNNCSGKCGENKKINQYEEIAKIIGTNSNWIILRWNMLRNRFFKEYRLVKHRQNDYKIKFKYFNNMMFLTNNLRQKNIPDFKTVIYQDKNFGQFFSLAENNPEFILEETLLKNWSSNNRNYFVFNEQKILNTANANISNNNCKTIRKTDRQYNEEQNIGPEVSENRNRCEDIIFGELVTAMLKEMPIDKKKLIKKEIMNIMLS